MVVLVLEGVELGEVEDVLVFAVDLVQEELVPVADGLLIIGPLVARVCRVKVAAGLSVVAAVLLGARQESKKNYVKIAEISKNKGD